MVSRRAEKAYQFSVVAPGLPGLQIFLVEAPSDALAERRLRQELKLKPTATITLQRSANADDVQKFGLAVGGVIRIK